MLLKLHNPRSTIKEENDAFGATKAVTPTEMNTFVAGYVLQEMLCIHVQRATHPLDNITNMSHGNTKVL